MSGGTSLVKNADAKRVLVTGGLGTVGLQLGPSQRGAGSSPAARRTFFTVVAGTLISWGRKRGTGTGSDMAL
jgi:hypothetical protein